MRIDRRLTILGVMLVVLSTVMATQYATTKTGFSYSIVHPSNADIRFFACDNSSAGNFVYRITGNNESGNRYASLEFGNWSEGQNKTYTAAFGIVNEEPFPVTITHAVVTTSGGNDYMQIWLHGSRNQKADEAGEEVAEAVMIWNKNATAYVNGSSAWVLAAGDGDPFTFNGSTAATNGATFWNATGQVRYNCTTLMEGASGLYDFVFVQISIDIPAGAAPTAADTTGTIYMYFNSTAVV